jgi:hypothetical protein
LELVSPNDIADYQVVRPIVTRFCRPFRHRACFFEHDFMGVEGAGDLNRRFLSSFRDTQFAGITEI